MIAELAQAGKIKNIFDFKPSTLIKMLALPEGDEQAFIDAQAHSVGYSFFKRSKKVAGNGKILSAIAMFVDKIVFVKKVPHLRGVNNKRVSLGKFSFLVRGAWLL